MCPNYDPSMLPQLALEAPDESQTRSGNRYQQRYAIAAP